MKSLYIVVGALIHLDLVRRVQTDLSINTTFTEAPATTNNTSSISVTSYDDDIVDPCIESNKTQETNANTTHDCKSSETGNSDEKEGSEVDYVGFVLVPIFLIVGLSGNGMTIAVMRSIHFRNMTSSMILIALALSDSGFLLTLPFNKMFFRQLVGTDIRAISEVGCKTFFCLFRSTKMTSSWFVVFVCFERFVAVWFPLKAKLICTRQNTMIGIVCVYIGIFTLNGIWSFSTKVINGACVPNAIIPGSESVTGWFMMVGIMAYSVIPTIILLILTPAICFKLFQHARLRRSMSKNHDDYSAETAKTTTMLLGVTFAFIVLTFPSWLGHIIAFLQGENLFESSAPGILEFREISQVMEHLNYIINFFLYVLCSKSFRVKAAQFLGFRMCLDQSAKKKGNDNTSVSMKTVSAQLA